MAVGPCGDGAGAMAVAQVTQAHTGGWRRHAQHGNEKFVCLR